MRVFDVLVVTGDAGMLAMLCRSISAQPSLRIAGRCETAEGAEALARASSPDVIALDMQLAGTDTAALISRLKAICDASVVAMSTVTGIALDTLNAGATDFVYIPERGSNSDYGSSLADAVDRIKIAAALRRTNEAGRNEPTGGGPALAVIAGASGGPVPLACCMSRLPSDGLAVLAVQWQAGAFSADFRAALCGMTGREALEGEDGMEMRPGSSYVVAGSRLVAVEAADGKPVIRLGGVCRSRDEQAEALFASAAALGLDVSGALLYESQAGEDALKKLAARGMPAIKLNKNEILREVGYKPDGGVLELPLEDIAAAMLA